MSRTRFVLIVLVIASLAAFPAGCKRARKAEVTSAWPVANAERVVPKPPTPPKWPLTGMPAPSDAATTRRVISVKVENSPQARPQMGLNAADVVYETVVEGGITRFNALYHSKQPEAAGPVRSARLSDLYIVPQYGALFFYSGATYSINRQVKSAGLENLSQDNGVSRPYYRSSSRRSPHNLYLRIGPAREEAKRRKYPTTQKVKPLRFGSAAETSQTASEISIPLSGFNPVSWEYAPKSRVYLRRNNGTRFMDAATDSQVRATNVVVLWAQYKAVGRDKIGSTTYAIALSGKGRATIFRGGKRFDGTWIADRSAPPVIKATDGSVLRLAPGNTWFEVVDTSVNISMK